MLPGAWRRRAPALKPIDDDWAAALLRPETGTPHASRRDVIGCTLRCAPGQPASARISAGRSTSRLAAIPAQAVACSAESDEMDTRNPAARGSFGNRREARQHRFMESSDINAAFSALFAALRTNIRRGMSTDGQLYAIEMDGCIPGGLLATTWIPLSTHGIDDAAKLADASRRRAFFSRLYTEPRAEALFAYVCEHAAPGSSVLYLEVVSADATYAASYPIGAGSGWHRRDLARVPHRRLPSPNALPRGA